MLGRWDSAQAAGSRSVGGAVAKTIAEERTFIAEKIAALIAETIAETIAEEHTRIAQVLSEKRLLSSEAFVSEEITALGIHPSKAVFAPRFTKDGLTEDELAA